MYELIQAGPQSYYVQCPAKIGIFVRENGEAFLIDSGSDKDAAKKVKKHLDQQGWSLKAVLVTHSHADHIGGCQYLQKQTGCKILSSGIEASFTAYPELEPAFLYGGNPPKDLQHKSLMAQPSDVDDLTDPVYPAELTPIGLPGHSVCMVGYLTPDGTVFLADCVSSEQTLEKYGISYLYDVQASLETLDYVQSMTKLFPQIRLFVPSHADAVEDIGLLVQRNREKILEIADVIVNLCADPTDFEALLQRIFQHYGLIMNFQQYVLLGSTVKSYLSWLKAQGRVEAIFQDCRLLWKKMLYGG